MRIVHRNRLLDWIESITTTYSDVQFSGSTIKTITRTQLKVTLHSNYTARGGGTWVYFGWVCAARDSKLAPRSK